MSGRPRAAGWMLALCLGAGLPAAADTEIAREGQSCPDTGGGTFWEFGQTRITDAGWVAFYALCRFPGQGTWSPRGLFAHDGVALRKLVMTLDPAPGPPGAYFDQILALSEGPAVNDQGEFVFEANFGVPPVGAGGNALFEGGPGGLQELVRAGDPLPPPLTGTFFSFARKDLNDAGELVFEATLSSTFDNGLFRISNGQITVVAAEGMPVPDGSGELWGEFGTPTINSHGDIAFHAFVGGQPGAVALIRDGVTELVVRGGDTAPGTGGMLFTRFVSDRVAIDDQGGVVFLAEAGHGSAQGVFRYADGEVVAIALRDTKAPFPGAVLDYLRFQPSVSRSGRVVIPVYVENDAGQFDALIQAVGTQLHAVRLAGDPAPGGDTYVEFSNGATTTPPSIDSLGTVAFNALLDDGSNAVFLASPGAQVPAVPPPAWLGGAATLLVIGRAQLRRLRRRT
ncbi:MAG TPA: choice-of-anchor tandem repeat NxxGxxAF-containing protein [Myxococcota bacterium]|nr:choice-of-anchor tandem repeat NxxGxxAF-containing protein [Myxococcota bacterium]